MKKRVLLITVRSDVGGGPKHVDDLLTYASTKDFDFFVASPESEPFGPKFREKAKGFFPLPHRKFSLLRFLKLISYLEKNDIHIVHSHGRGAGIYSRLLSLFGIRIIHTFHGIHQPKTFSDKFKGFAERVLGQLTDCFLFVSNSERDQAKRLGILNKGTNRVIPNGIALDAEVDSYRALPPSTFKNIGIVSRFDPHKNVLRGIALFSKLVSENPELHLNIAGDGEQKDQALALVKELRMSDKVTFHGFVDSPLEFLRQQDVYLSTSLGEGLPYTVLESMKVNTIPLISNVSGHIDILPPKYLFDLENDEDFIHKFNSLKNSKDHDFRVILEKNYNVLKQIQKITEVY
ncbi:MAG: glycosyltransferase [Bacteriovoracaceae bacterium]|nr:glycosyltransferase [Bacteriovoracaceae bacterium]